MIPPENTTIKSLNKGIQKISIFLARWHELFSFSTSHYSIGKIMKTVELLRNARRALTHWSSLWSLGDICPLYTGQNIYLYNTSQYRDFRKMRMEAANWSRKNTFFLQINVVKRGCCVTRPMSHFPKSGNDNEYNLQWCNPALNPTSDLFLSSVVYLATLVLENSKIKMQSREENLILLES